MNNIAKPRKDQKLYKNEQLIGKVDRLDGNICHFTNLDNTPDMFIYWFNKNPIESAQFNTLISWQ